MAALSEIQKLEARYAENPDGRFFAPLADAYRKAGELDRALELVTANLPKHPDYLSAHIVMGRCFLDKKDDTSASNAFQRVLELDRENIIALKSLAEIAERLGDTTSARRWLQRLLTIDAMNTEAADDLARLGGPLAEDGGEAAAAPAAEEDTRISFADIAVPEPAPTPEPVSAASAPTVPAPAIEEPIIPKTLERPAVQWPPAPPPPPPLPPEPEPEPAAAEPEEPVPAALPMMDLEPTSFEPPPRHSIATAADVVPTDGNLAWGASERTRAQEPAEPAPAHEETASAIDFMPPAPPVEATPTPPSMEPAGGWGDPNMSTLPMDSVPPPPAWSPPPAPPAPEPETPTVEMTPVRVPEPEPAAMERPPEPEPAKVAGEVTPEAVAAPAAAELPLIMPEDVTPADEMRRPSSKQLHMVSPDVEPMPDAAPAEPMVTETMGDLYLRQGLKQQAADVYRRLLAQRPGDAGLLAKLAAIESPPAMSAQAMGAEPVGSWLKRIAHAQLGSAAAPPPAPPEAGPTPMDQAFSAPEPDAAPEAVPADEPVAPGAPARPATDQFSLDQLFGSGRPAAAAPDPVPAPHTLGSSFDEFFGAAPKQETVRPSKESTPGGRQSEDDLSAFNAWLHGLKR